MTDSGSSYIADAIRMFAAPFRFIESTTPVPSPKINGRTESFLKAFNLHYVYVNYLPLPLSCFHNL